MNYAFFERPNMKFLNLLNFSSKKETMPKKKRIKFPSPVTAKTAADVFTDCYDFVTRQIALGGDNNKEVTLCFIDGLVDSKTLAETVLRPLTDSQRFGGDIPSTDAIAKMLGGVTYTASVKHRTVLDDVVQDLLNGFCAIIIDREQTAVTFEVRANASRSVSEPKEEKVIKGSKDAFIELLKMNTTLVRRKLKNPNLRIRTAEIGNKTGTSVAIVYINDFTNMEIVNEVEKRLKSINVEGVLTAAAIEENIVDSPATPFPQLISTERPDKFCMNILEGRVGIIVDGLPMGYLAPGTFAQYFKVPEDVANHFIVASALTTLRYIALIITLLLPAFYVAVTMYHHEMLPTKLMLSIIDAKEAVPFPTAIEVLLLLSAFELLQEAGLRLPNPIGETVSIIGALIVGQSAVEAKVVSPVVVIVIAAAGISGYTVPNQDMSSALRISRFILVLFAIAGGMFGIAAGVVILVYHLSSLESYGVAYMTPLAGQNTKKKGRVFGRGPMSGFRQADPALKTKESGQ
ncbi:MAG: spore germination protein [Ruminococcaceae bacterium]|nr:spore germination protein [Oscillospiraceae bacterium]